jgi:Reverse transcriptase (RNA-dependent DNA polymerase)/Endonuclease-reverse transcriptase
MNAQGLLSNLCEIKILVCENKPEIVCLSETHVTDKIFDSELKLENYSTIRCNSHSRHTGGVAIYVKEKYDFQEILNVQNGLNWVCAIKTHASKKCIYAVIYHSPSSSDADFVEIFEEWCELLFERAENCDIIITGDFNIDFSKPNLYQRKLQYIFESFGLVQMTKNFTRITNNSETLIDLVLTNQRTLEVIVSKPDKISDHETLKIFSDATNSKIEEEKEIFCWKNYSKENLHKELRKFDWTGFQFLGINEKAKIIHDSLTVSVNNLVTVKKIKIKNKNEWYNNQLKQLKNQVNNCRREIGKTTSSAQYKEIRNIYKNRVRSESDNSIKREIEKNKNNPKELWKNLRKLTDYKPKEKTHILFGEEYIQEKNDICNKFNEYFVSSVKEINESIPEENSLQPVNLENLEESRQFLFRLVEREEIEDIMRKMKKKSSINNVNISVFRDAFEFFGDIFTEFVNEILTTGIFPDVYKIATVIPIEKVNNTIKCEEFRPINMMPIEEKIIEQVVRDQLWKYVEENSLLCEQQSGFRSDYSCETALNFALDGWKNDLQMKKIIAVIFLDLKRAFETIDRKLLLGKLRRYGIRGTALNFFESYLSNRKQHCRYAGVCSGNVENELGVPQGTVIGPLLFILYINDIISSVLVSRLLLFADDTLITLSGDSVRDLEEQLNTDLSSLSKWLNFNKLKLNVEKSKFMVITNKKINKNEFELKIGNQRIERVGVMKYLGVILDDELKMDEHVDYVCKKMGQKYGFLCRTSKKLSTQSKILLYKATIATHIEYCSTVLFLASDEQVKRLQRIQNKIMRLILRAPKRTNVLWMLDAMQWQPLKQRIEMNTLSFIYKIIHNQLPDYLCNKIRYIKDIHNYNTRSGGNVALPRMTKTGSQNSLFYRGMKIYNELENEIKNANTVENFKKMLNNKYKCTKQNYV